MSESSVIIPEKDVVIIGDRKFPIGKFTLKQGLLFAKQIVKSCMASTEKIEEIQKRTKDSKNNIQDLIEIFDVIDEDEVFKLVGIMLKLYDSDGNVPEADLSFLQDNVEIPHLVEIAAIVLEKNDFKNVKKNIQRIQTIFQSKKETSEKDGEKEKEK